MNFEYVPQGVCSKKITFSLEDGVLHNVQFYGGCPGNLQGIAKLVEGKKAEEIATLLQGVSCGGKPTSCPDQLSRAVRQALETK